MHRNALLRQCSHSEQGRGGDTEVQCAEFREAGFEIHQETTATSVMQALGGVVDARQGLVIPTLCRLWIVILAAAGRRATAFGARYDHLCFAAGKYVRVQGPACSRLRRMPLWDSARRECLNFLSITPLLVEDLTRVWSQR